MSRKDLPLSDKMLELVASRFRILGEPLRLRILQLLDAGEATVNEIVEALHANQSNISKHLKLLYESGLVGRRRDQTSIHYFIADPVVSRLCELVCNSAAKEVRARFAEIAGPRALVKPRRRNKMAV